MYDCIRTSTFLEVFICSYPTVNNDEKVTSCEKSTIRFCTLLCWVWTLNNIYKSWNENYCCEIYHVTRIYIDCVSFITKSWHLLWLRRFYYQLLQNRVKKNRFCSYLKTSFAIPSSLKILSRNVICIPLRWRLEKKVALFFEKQESCYRRIIFENETVLCKALVKVLQISINVLYYVI